MTPNARWYCHLKYQSSWFLSIFIPQASFFRTFSQLEIVPLFAGHTPRRPAHPRAARLPAPVSAARHQLPHLWPVQPAAEHRGAADPAAVATQRAGTSTTSPAPSSPPLRAEPVARRTRSKARFLKSRECPARDPFDPRLAGRGLEGHQGWGGGSSSSSSQQQRLKGALSDQNAFLRSNKKVGGREGTRGEGQRREQ